MGTYHNQWSYTAPSGTTDIWLNAYRRGTNIVVDATVTCAFKYSNDYIAYDGEINFNMWSGAVNTSANIKGYSERWYYRNGSSKTRSCSMTIASTASSINVGFNLTVPAGNTRFSVPTTYVTLGGTDYIAPSAPTWASITPNPCNINSAPLITWGGASAGSSGIVVYDVEVRSTKSSGGWTNWLRISNSQSGTSYQEIALKNMSVYGQAPYVGVKYQYRIRVWDGNSVGSAWTNTAELSVGFGSPTPPSSTRWSSTTAKKGTQVTLTWSGASGGTGSINGYELSYRYYHAATNKWDNWTGTTIVSRTSNTYTLSSTAKNNDRFQVRIRTRNSWGQYSSYVTTGSVTIRGNQMWIKVNGSWKEGECYIKINGSWKEGTPWIKVNGSWKEST